MCTSSEGDSSQEFLLFLFFFFLLYSCQRHETEKKHKASSVPTPELNFSGQFGEDFENSIWSLKLGNKTVTLLWDVRLSSSPKIHFEVSWKRSHNLPLNIEQIETKVLTRIFELAFILSHEHCWWALPPLSSTLWTSSCPLFFYLLPLFSPPPCVFYFFFFYFCRSVCFCLRRLCHTLPVPGHGATITQQKGIKKANMEGGAQWKEGLPVRCVLC